MEFIVRTDESVSGGYIVVAEDEQEAQEKVEALLGGGEAAWEDVNQLSYEAFEVEVKEVEAA
ncbi:MAG TPA: hypothetical protein V6C72_10310 [Chroococcales cyanobacterium]